MTERDLYMIYVMRRLAAFGDRVVAVVGAGHLAGIRQGWACIAGPDLPVV